jgi:hypothetical protein
VKITSVAVAICFAFLIFTVGTIYAQRLPVNIAKVIQDKYTTKVADGVLMLGLSLKVLIPLYFREN